jgi:protein involved in polysaccharide export with SLBB domain
MRFAPWVAVIALAACGRTAPAVQHGPLRPRFSNASGGPVLVVGAVARPAVVPWYRGMGIRYAIRAAGGATQFATRRAVVTRQELGQQRMFVVRYADLPEIELAPGDIVRVVEPHP